MNGTWATLDRLTYADVHRTRCNLCEHRCGVNRRAGERGPCKASANANVFRHRIEYGEEPELVPSHLFYLSGCDLRCVFCIAGLNAFDPTRGRPLTGDFFRRAVAWGQARGARNVQWVGGEPTVHLPSILDAMADCPDLPPVVWKSDFHCTPGVFDLLDGVADTYVADFKFGNDRCANSLAGVNDYVRIITRNLEIASTRARLIVRHLLLPGHAECCYAPVVRWMREHLPSVPMSIREGYLPSWRASRFGDLARPLSPGEGRAAKELARGLGLRVIQ